MGIGNLLQFLRPMQTTVSLANYEGKVVAVDAMCWIHRGMISSAVANVTGEPCDKYIKFIVSILSVLLSHKITPIMVFDGYDMPTKETENQLRRERRDKAREEALAMIEKNGGAINTEIMRKCMQAIHITPEVIARVMEICRAMNVRIVVAPYEADAQVSYLCRSGIAYAALSEDSDLLVYGCPRVWFKLERDGKADELTLGFNKDPDVKCNTGLLKGLSHRMFIAMCVLSGSDYDNGCHIHGMGIKLAHRFILQYETLPAVMAFLQSSDAWSKKFPAHLTIKELEAYYMRVMQIFLHNIVYDVRHDTLRHISPVSDGATNMEIIRELTQLIRERDGNFRMVSEGLINPRNGESMSYTMTDKDRELIEGIEFRDIDALYSASMRDATCDALMEKSSPDDTDGNCTLPGKSPARKPKQAKANNPSPPNTPKATRKTTANSNKSGGKKAKGKEDNNEEVSSLTLSQKRKLRDLIDSSERVALSRPKRRCTST
ncbi:XPG I-region nuclease family protein [Babesia bovis T2Bo]|uniref:XPG I-region nuclease family protein n=1 Tax=Babesia bovis T2Bo TaxID=484906 RepID=UPI001C357BE9|nr:XPG I-region nuclease family protein [Babesia bovis T2Bo]EDO06341.2 XPG I-region nuclease family protein [Babesia bovis T2Bo]